MVRAGEIEHGAFIASKAEAIWNWSTPAGKLRAQRRARLICDSAKLNGSTHALELGCGTGLFTKAFAKTGARVTAIDVSPDLLELAERKMIGDRVTFECADAENLTYADGSFDVVIGSSVLHHLDINRALQEAHRVLTPGGRLAFAEPNMMNPQIALQRGVPLFRKWAGESPEETAFFRWGLAKQLRRAGFTEVCIEPFDFLHPAVPRSLIPLIKGIEAVLEFLPISREIAGSLIISATRESEERSSGDEKF